MCRRGAKIFAKYIEFKSEAVKATTLAEEVVAFADSEGGEIWLGVADDGSISGLSRSYEEDVMNNTSQHKYFIRVGSTKRVASREELIRLFQASGALHYDILEVERAQLTDLDLGQIGQYFNRYQISFFQLADTLNH